MTDRWCPECEIMIDHDVTTQIGGYTKYACTNCDNIEIITPNTCDPNCTDPPGACDYKCPKLAMPEARFDCTDNLGVIPF